MTESHPNADRWRGTLLGALGVAFVLTAAPARAETDNGTVSRAFAKAATYQTLSSLNDFAFGYLVAGSALVGGAMAAVTTVTEPVFYLVHEMAWDAAIDRTGLDEADLLGPRMVTYGAINAGRVFGVGLLLTGSPAAALGYVGVSLVGDSLAFAFNDLAWSTFAPRHHATVTAAGG